MIETSVIREQIKTTNNPIELRRILTRCLTIIDDRNPLELLKLRFSVVPAKVCDFELGDYFIRKDAVDFYSDRYGIDSVLKAETVYTEFKYHIKKEFSLFAIPIYQQFSGYYYLLGYNNSIFEIYSVANPRHKTEMIGCLNTDFYKINLIDD